MEVRQSLAEIQDARKGVMSPLPDPDGESQKPAKQVSSAFSELEELFLVLSDIPVNEREAKLLDLCSDNVVRQKVRALLDADSQEDRLLNHSFITKPAKRSSGDHIGPYRLVNQIGEGGMGVVYLAEQIEPVKRRVALKVIKPGVGSHEVIARFNAERQALSVMDHPNIAKVLDAGTAVTGEPFFVMELVNGPPLTDYCETNHLTERQRLEIFLPVCAAIQHAHQKGIIHRDIKPSNVLVAVYEGQPLAKVIDFGVAKAINQPLTDMTVRTGFGQILGTFGYMSPEQTRPNQLDVDTRSDIYSLGVLLYELIAGATPFDNDRFRSGDWEDILKIVREEDPLVPSLRRAKKETGNGASTSDFARRIRLLSNELDWIVMKALEKDPNRRYQTPSALAKDIERYLVGDAVAACPPSNLYRFRKFAARHRFAVAMCSTVFCLFTLGLVGTSWQAIRATRAEAVAETNANKANDSAKKAESINRFLIEDVLGLVGAEAQLTTGLRPDPNIKLVTLLERALGEVDSRYATQPELAIQLKETLAQSLVSIGRYDDASGLYRQVLKYLESKRGLSHPTTIKAMQQMAAVEIHNLRIADASTLCKRALDALRACGPEHGDQELLRLQLLGLQAAIYQKQHRFGDALALHKKCLALKQSILPKDHHEILTTMSTLADLHESLNQFAEAERLHLEVLAVRRQVESDTHPIVAASLHSLGKCYLKRGQFAGEPKDFALSETNLSQSLDIYRRVRGEDHPETLAVQQQLANVFCESRKLDEAERLLNDLVIRLDRVIPNHLTNLEAKNALAWVYLQKDGYAQAENILAQAIEVYLQLNLDVEDPLYLRMQGNLAIAYQRLGKIDLSIALDETLSALTEKVLGENHFETLASKARLGLSRIEIGQVKEGRELLQFVADAGPNLAGVYKICGIIANSFSESGEIEQTVHWTRREVTCSRNCLPANSPPLAESLAQSSARLMKLSRWKEAEVLLNECLAILEANGSKANEQHLVRSRLGHTLFAQAKHAEALPHLIAAYEGTKKHRSGKSKEQIRNLRIELERVIACCAVLNKEEAATVYREELANLRNSSD